METKFVKYKEKSEKSFMAFLNDLRAMCVQSLKMQVYDSLSPSNKLLVDIDDPHDALLKIYGDSFINELRNEMINYLILMMAVI